MGVFTALGITVAVIVVAGLAGYVVCVYLLGRMR
jgi:hypothetical protein